MSRLVDADDAIRKMESVMDMQELYLPIHFKEWVIDEVPTIEERKWIPFVFRELDEEEKEVHPDWCYIMENTPEHGQEILVSNGKWVWADTFYDDDGCYLDSGSDMEGCAWMPFPKPWKGEGDGTD